MKSMKSVRCPWRMAALAIFMLLGMVATTPAYTLIVAPARYSVLQVAFDLLARSSAVLVSYQVDPKADEPVLHAWNGSEWVLLTSKDYREGNFLQQVPERVVLLGDDGTLPASVLESSTWVSDVVRVRDLNTRSLVNEFGHLQNWRASEWAWFAKRYNLQLQDESEALRKSSWYDRPGPLPGRPHVLDRVTEGPAKDLTPVPVVASETVDSTEAVDAVAPVEAVDAAAPVEAVEPVAPAAEATPTP